MQAADLAARLAALHDVVVPAPVPWWPPAPGWYGIAALALGILALGGWRAFLHWRASAYRRVALRRLAGLRVELADPGRRGCALAEVAALLRRAALHVAPRERVAALSGEAWLDFLDAGVGGNAFRGDAGRLIANAPFQPAYVIARLTDAELDALCRMVERWLRAHRPARYAVAPATDAAAGDVATRSGAAAS